MGPILYLGPSASLGVAEFGDNDLGRLKYLRPPGPSLAPYARPEWRPPRKIPLARCSALGLPRS